MEPSSSGPDAGITASTKLPRITIQFCTQCRWMLRAAYFAQELLSTFSLSIGEIALIPSTGGIFVVDIVHEDVQKPITGTPKDESTRAEDVRDSEEGVGVKTTRLWDKKLEGGFPETKILKRRVRDIIDPDRNLGHVDRTSHGASAPSNQQLSSTSASISTVSQPTAASVPPQPSNLSTSIGIPSKTAIDQSSANPPVSNPDTLATLTTAQSQDQNQGPTDTGIESGGGGGVNGKIPIENKVILESPLVKSIAIAKEKGEEARERRKGVEGGIEEESASASAGGRGREKGEIPCEDCS